MPKIVRNVKQERSRALDTLIEIDHLINSTGIKANGAPVFEKHNDLGHLSEDIKSLASGQGSELIWFYHFNSLVEDDPFFQAGVKLKVGPEPGGRFSVLYNPERNVWHADTIWAERHPFTRKLAQFVPRFGTIFVSRARELIRVMAKCVLDAQGGQ